MQIKKFGYYDIFEGLTFTNHCAIVYQHFTFFQKLLQRMENTKLSLHDQECHFHSLLIIMTAIWIIIFSSKLIVGVVVHQHRMACGGGIA